MFQNFPNENFNKGGVVLLLNAKFTQLHTDSPDISSIRPICRICSDFYEIRITATSLQRHHTKCRYQSPSNHNASRSHKRPISIEAINLEISRKTVIEHSVYAIPKPSRCIAYVLFSAHRLCMMPC